MASPPFGPTPPPSRRRLRSHTIGRTMNPSDSVTTPVISRIVLGQSQSSALQSNVASHEARLVSVLSRVKSFEARVESQDTVISYLGSRISCIRSDLVSNDARISSLEAQSWSLDDHTPDVTKCSSTVQGEDHFGRLPVELRLMVYKALLIAPSPMFRGVKGFGKLPRTECMPKITVFVSTGILRTCQRYYDEAVPILYTKNHMIFCTGPDGLPGWFDRFPIGRKYMHFLTKISIYFRVTDPEADASSKVAHFLNALARRAPNLRHLTVCAGSDRYYGAACPIDILFLGHPVVLAIRNVIARKTVQHLKLRMHDDAAFAPTVATLIQQFFDKHDPKPDSTLTFTRSCSSPDDCAIHARDGCQFCGKTRAGIKPKGWPIEDIVRSPEFCEASVERIWELTDDLFEPEYSDDGEEEDDEEDDNNKSGDADDDKDDLNKEYDESRCRYCRFDCRSHFDDAYRGTIPRCKEKSDRRAFALSDMEREACWTCGCEGGRQGGRIGFDWAWDMRVRQRQSAITDFFDSNDSELRQCGDCGSVERSPRCYRGDTIWPAVGRMRQSRITKFFKVITYEKYFEMLFPSSYNAIPTESSHGVGHLPDSLKLKLNRTSLSDNHPYRVLGHFRG